MLDAKHKVQYDLPMNQLSIAKRVKILSLLCEGISMRSISRAEDVSVNTVMKLLVDAGESCLAFHNAAVQGVTTKRVQCDEIWSFTYAKQKNVATAKTAPDGAGDTWTWTAIDADSKLIISWLVGSRDAACAHQFMSDVASRIKNRIQLTTDGYKAYFDAVEDTFLGEIDYAVLVKIYGRHSHESVTRYSPAECIGTKVEIVNGDPDPEHISTSYVERHNLSMRMHMRRFTRLTNAFSKKFANHVCMVALYTVFYNFIKIHKTLRVTPAMEAGLVDRVLTFEEIAVMIEANAPKPGPRGPYKREKIA
jgi:IS1 family transposase